jgi:mannosyl-oligosaccharide alpha-1,2-mannosidase
VAVNPPSTGIGAEVFGYISSDGDFNGKGSPDVDQQAFYDKHGFYITAADYILRPEVLESNFYAWRVTGDPKYLDRAKQAIGSFTKYLETPSGGYSGLFNVDSVVSERVDDQESFWFAEVLKYL